MTRDPEAWARLGRALRIARERKGWSQQDVATHAEVSRKSVQDAEGGKVPRARMPYTLGPIARALGWKAGAVEDVLDGAEPPGGWRNVSVTSQVDAQTATFLIENAVIRASDSATAAEIKEAARIAVDELRRHGVISETNETQPSGEPTKR